MPNGFGVLNSDISRCEGEGNLVSGLADYVRATFTYSIMATLLNLSRLENVIAMIITAFLVF